jgi:hypothetical protein
LGPELSARTYPRKIENRNANADSVFMVKSYECYSTI